MHQWNLSVCSLVVAAFTIAGCSCPSEMTTRPGDSVASAGFDRTMADSSGPAASTTDAPDTRSTAALEPIAPPESDGDTVLRQPIEELAYIYHVDNGVRDSFGFDSDQGPFARGPNAVAILGDAAYIVDSYHGNVKRIDLWSGAITCSRPIVDDDALKPNDIVANGGHLFLCGYDDTVRELDGAMRLVRVTSLPERYWRTEKFFLRHDTTFAEVYCPTEREVLEIEGGDVRIVTVDDRGGTEELGANPFLTVEMRGGHYFARSPVGLIRLEEHPRARPDYDPFQWAATARWFVYFDVEPNLVRVHVLRLR